MRSVPETAALRSLRSSRRAYLRAAPQAADRAMIDYVLKLTRPGPMAASDLDGLRSHGFDDLMILQLVQTAGYYAFANRLVDALGVPLEHHVSGG